MRLSVPRRDISEVHRFLCGCSCAECEGSQLGVPVFSIKTECECVIILIKKYVSIGNALLCLVYLCFFVDIFIYTSNIIPFPCFPSITLLSHSPSTCFYEGVPPPTHLLLPASLLWHSPTLGHGALVGPRASPIGTQQSHPLLHMQLEPWVCPCVFFGMVVWELWLVDIVVLMGLQTPSAPLISYLTPSLGNPFSVQWLAASMCLCICHALAEPLGRQLLWACSSWCQQYCLGLVAFLIWAGSPGGAVFEWLFLRSLLQTLSLYFLLWIFLFPLLRRTEGSICTLIILSMSSWGHSFKALDFYSQHICFFSNLRSQHIAHTLHRQYMWNWFSTFLVRKLRLQLN